MKNKPLLATVSFLFLALSVYAGVLLVTSDETFETRGQAAQVPTLTLQTDEASFAPLTNFAASIYLDTSNQPIDSYQAIIEYDPEVLKAISVTPQSVFEQQRVTSRQIDQENGRITYAVTPATGTSPDTIQGSTAIIVFQGLKEGMTKLKVHPDSSASIAPSHQNIIANTPDLTLNIAKKN